MASAPAQQQDVPATAEFLSSMAIEDIAAWRVADVPGRPSAAERNLPAEFAIGWYAVAYSPDLVPGQVKSARYLGHDMAVWRGEDGKARVLDAYCAHYGANMSIGGKVSGNLLECPFHSWKFNGEGAVEQIPYAKIVPPQARKKNCVRSWPTEEHNGLILVWYHPENKEPLWPALDVPEASDPNWTDYETFEWRIFTGLENMADNAVDVAHFRFVHGSPSVPEYTYEYDGIKRLVTSDLRFVTPRGEVRGQIISRSHGPGQGSVRFTGITETVLVSAVTPVELDELHVRFCFTQPRVQAAGKGANVAKAMLRDICKQLDQDKVILDRHRVMRPPLYCDGDGPFARNNEYYSQFFLSANPESRFDTSEA